MINLGIYVCIAAHMNPNCTEVLFVHIGRQRLNTRLLRVLVFGEHESGSHL